ncbi:MAG: hypothetical protein M3511_01390 [Deinococcota bacterium]|nr:hypothetical protein [Deinococcota bacterium]
MNPELLERLQTTQQTLEPRFKALRGASAALKQAIKLASDEKADALPMQKALVKLQQATDLVGDEAMRAATENFRAETERALDALAFEFARDLKETFEGRGETVTGRPPTLVVGWLLLNIDIAARKAQWFYGKEALTRPLTLSIATIMQAYEQQKRAVEERSIDTDAFLGELYRAWRELLEERSRRRINLVETYSRLVMNRQSARFWNAPSRGTFKDYERPLFVRDLAQAQASPVVTVDGQRYRLRLGTATKSQADSASRSIWLPSGPVDGEYYADITFEEAPA